MRGLFRSTVSVLATALLASAACSRPAPEQQAHTGAATPAATRSSDLASWAGRYRYTENAGRSAAGTGIVLDYELTIPPDARDAILRIVGFQADDTILGSLSGNADEVSVRFRSYGGGQAVNRYGVAEYEIGAELFTIARTSAGQLVTTWGHLEPDSVQQPRGVYFRAVDR